MREEKNSEGKYAAVRLDEDKIKALSGLIAVAAIMIFIAIGIICTL